MARVRTFLAIDLPKPVRAACVSLQEQLTQAAPAVKWVERENLHVTLLFLGEVDERRDLVSVCRAAQKVCSTFTPFVLQVSHAGCFGDPRRPRTIWVGIEEGASELIEVHDALEEAMLDLGCYRREERRYTPHITLGRVKGDEPSPDLPEALSRHKDWQGGECPVSEVRVLSSDLTRGGPIYGVLSRAKLG